MDKFNIAFKIFVILRTNLYSDILDTSCVLTEILFHAQLGDDCIPKMQLIHLYLLMLNIVHLL